jgi:nitrogen fixation protein NifU and related proteins
MFEMGYSEKLLDYFQNPRCVGEIPDAHSVAEVSNPVCGDVMKLWVKVNDGRIQDAKFKAQGCSAAIATSSYATEMVIGMTVAEARQITKEQIAEALGGLPPSKIHCSVLASDAIKEVLKGF